MRRAWVVDTAALDSSRCQMSRRHDGVPIMNAKLAVFWFREGFSHFHCFPPLAVSEGIKRSLILWTKFYAICKLRCTDSAVVYRSGDHVTARPVGVAVKLRVVLAILHLPRRYSDLLYRGMGCARVSVDSLSTVHKFVDKL